MKLLENKILKIALAGYAVFFLLAHGISWANTDLKAASSYKEKALTAINAYHTRLGSELKAALQSGGPEAAIAVCSEAAPAIAQETSKEFGLDIGRTSLKHRNAANDADGWETAMLKQFDARKQDGAAPETMEASYQDDKVFRYMKAIPMKGMCATCHGTNVDPELYKAIKAYYPDDRAINFKPGDIRGAFTVSMPIQPVSTEK